MKLKKLGISLIIAVAAVLGTITIFGQVKPNKSKAVWEYKATYLKDWPDTAQTDGLNQLGSDGWELVGVAKACEGCTTLAYFKRLR